MKDGLRTPRVLVWLLRRLTSRDASDAAIGDILEGLEERRAQNRAPRRPALWLRAQIALAIWPALRLAMPRFVRTCGHTVREALRGMRRRPSQALFIVVVLAVGMSAATVTFSVVDATVLRPLPFDEGERIVTITGRRPTSSAYFPLETAGRGWVGFFIRTSVPAGPVAREVHETLLTMVRPGQWPEVHVVSEAFSLLTATRRFNGLLMSLFAVLAISIGCAGVYAAMASAVAQRTREIGVRIALGATVPDIRRSVLAESGRYLLLGLAIGLPAGWLMSRSFGSIFFQVAPGDLEVHAIVAAVLVIAGLVAAMIPARRASRVDPVVTLRAL